MSAQATALHATVVAIGEAGVLLRGRSGAGKSALALDLLAAAAAEGRFARLVGDDRVLATLAGGRLIARPHPTLAGRIEQRFSGIVAETYEPAVVLRLAVDLVDRRPADDHPPRAPLETERLVDLLGARLLRLAAPIGDPGTTRRILGRLKEIFP